MKRSHSPDSVCDRYADLGVDLSIRRLDEDDVLIEGSERSLEFLGELLLAQATFEGDCGFQISPRGPGQALFADDSELGLYLHNLDRCSDPDHGRPPTGVEVDGGPPSPRGRHPYEAWEGTELWEVLEEAIGELVENQDLQERTPREYIVGFLARRLASKQRS